MTQIDGGNTEIFYPQLSFDEEDRLLVEAVNRGEKPSCSIVASEEAYQFATSCGLLVRRGWNAFHQFPNPKSITLEISRYEKCDTFPIYQWLQEYFGNLPEIACIVAKLFEDLRDWYIADALAFLAAYPRVDDFGRPISLANTERSEITALQGFFFGYKPCCVRYVVGMAHAGETPHLYHKKATSLLGGILCEPCAYRLAENELSLKM